MLYEKTQQLGQVIEEEQKEEKLSAEEETMQVEN